MKHRIARTIFTAWAVLALAGCTGIPETIEPVTGFELERYLGDWYEIARLDHSFERGLERITASYSMRDDGGVRVVNRGYHVADGRWNEAEGKAYFIGDPAVGRLKVSFFGPFYGAYNIFALDQENYRWAMVAGPDYSYLWVLSRTPAMAPELLQELLMQAAEAGFDTEAIIRVSHELQPAQGS
jgi:apolipoprotein D and lipocalin family protein